MAKATAELCEVRLNILCVFERRGRGRGVLSGKGDREKRGGEGGEEIEK